MLKGKIVRTHATGGELVVARRDDKQGPFDKNPKKFFLNNFSNPDQAIPKAGTHVLAL